MSALANGGPGRRVQRNPDITRSRILDASLEQFSEQGFHGASTRGLGRAADVNIGTLAYHFGGKDGLYLATLEYAYGRLLSFQLPAPLPSSSEERVRMVVATVFRSARRERSSVRLLLRHVLEHRSLPEDFRTRWNQRLFARLLELEQELELPELTGRPLALVSINHLLARFAVAEEEDLVPFVVDGDPVEAVATHLGDVAVQLLLGPGPA